MNCAKCFKAGVTIRLQIIPSLVKDHHKYKCPVCRAIFFFPLGYRANATNEINAATDKILAPA